MTHPFDRLHIPDQAGSLLFTPCPGTKETSLASALETLHQAGAVSVISLMPLAELEQNGAGDIAAQCNALGLEWFHLPVADEQAPQSDFDLAWMASKDRLLALLTSGQSAAIHCKGGSGRTGLIAARILMAKGVPRASAISLVQALRPKAIQHPAHLAWINQFDAS